MKVIYEISFADTDQPLYVLRAAELLETYAAALRVEGTTTEFGRVCSSTGSCVSSANGDRLTLVAIEG